MLVRWTPQFNAFVCLELSSLSVFVTGDFLQLQQDVKTSIRNAFAPGTWKNFKVQWKAYFLFCHYFDMPPLPASLDILCSYAQFLGRSFKSHSSISNYLSGVRSLHLFADVPCPSLSDFQLKLLLRGLAREKAHCPVQAAPVTLDVLLRIRMQLDLAKPLHATFWCLFLFAFFLMARKSNLVPDSIPSFDPDKQLIRDRVKILEDHLIVTFPWSKTNQFGNRLLEIPLCEIPHSPLCPVSAFRHMCSLVPAQGRSPAFSKKVGRGVVPITYQEFQKFLKTSLSAAGINPVAFSSHSFRRGGATFAFQSQVPVELIQLHGDWASDAYKLYLCYSLKDKLKVSQSMREQINTFTLRN